MEPALDEVLRRELVDVAADALGRLPAEDVPPSLRAVARFAPAKRRRLGAAALAAAVDGDEAFRAALARVVEDGSPDLVAAVRSGASTAASDPADVAVVAYLLRPPGWADVVAGAQQRLARERATEAGPADDRVAGLTAELAELRARLRGEPARRRAAVAEAVGALEDELAAARRAVRDRTRELRAAERERDELQARRDDEQAATARQVAAAEAEARRLRARVGELERAVEAARRGTRVARDVDDARLWLLVDTLVRAATGVRSELALAAPDLRPADTVVAPDATASAGPGASVADAAALDRLLALPNVHLVVDGYNVTKTGYGALALDQQRARLVGSLAPLAAQSGAEVTVVFDGAERPPAQPVAPRGVRVLFSAPGEIADDLIRRVVAAEPPGRPVAVVTSDQAVVADVRREGAWAVPSAVLLARLA